MKSAEELLTDSKHFCILPWIHFHAWPDKKVLPCCVANSDYPVSEVKDGQSILDMMNSEQYKKMRLAMINDEPWEPCTRCYQIEDLGEWTMRKGHNMVALKDEENFDLVDDTNIDGSIDEFKLKYMDIRFSNLCNFKCRSCGPECSSLSGDEELKVVGPEEFENRFKRKQTLISTDDGNDFMSQLKLHLDDVEEVYFAGGEILVQPQHYECLDYWVENKLYDQVMLGYTTNMSKLQHKIKGKEYDLFDYWSKFSNMEIWASIDATGEQAELMRKGTNWKKVISNLKKIKQDCPHIRLGITPTISLWNVWHYTDMLDELYEQGILDLRYPPRVNILTKPASSSISNLPRDISQRLVEKIEKHMTKYEKLALVDTGDEHTAWAVKNTFLVLLTALKKTEGNSKNIKNFFVENAEMDNLRNEDMITVIPELEELYTWAHAET